MSSKFKQFKDLHGGKDLFILPNAWDAKSALLFKEKNFPAIGTSSAAVAAALGYEDGERMPFNHYLFVIERICASVQVPVTVDIEMGYGKTNQTITDNILKLRELGIAGVNIEDSEIVNSKRSLKDALEFAKTIEHIKNTLMSKNLDLFVNIRCDTYILHVKDKHKETEKRLKLYETSGADGVFLPCISNGKDISEAVSHTSLPLNVMCFPGLPDFDTLNKLGVKRVSMGPFLFNKIYKKAAELSQKVIEKKDVSPIL
jgi:2-methylisocitrate lyase-like PEP mutase family enzyme